MNLCFVMIKSIPFHSTMSRATVLILTKNTAFRSTDDRLRIATEWSTQQITSLPAIHR